MRTLEDTTHALRIDSNFTRLCKENIVYQRDVIFTYTQCPNPGLIFMCKNDFFSIAFTKTWSCRFQVANTVL